MAKDDSVLLTKYCSQEGWFWQKKKKIMHGGRAENMGCCGWRRQKEGRGVEGLM